MITWRAENWQLYAAPSKESTSIEFNLFKFDFVNPWLRHLNNCMHSIFDQKWQSRDKHWIIKAVITVYKLEYFLFRFSLHFTFQIFSSKSLKTVSIFDNSKIKKTVLADYIDVGDIIMMIKVGDKISKFLRSLDDITVSFFGLHTKDHCHKRFLRFRSKLISTLPYSVSIIWSGTFIPETDLILNYTQN